ncbi:MAG: hypothetical protein ACFFG0_00785 [Candidatus Thorarchaeota archaeon]
MKDPCENCLVKVCCDIRTSKIIYKSDCKENEIYRTMKMLKDYNTHKFSYAYINMKNRLRELGVNV